MMWAAAGTGETSTSMLDFSGFAGWHLVPRALIGCCECERGTVEFDAVWRLREHPYAQVRAGIR